MTGKDWCLLPGQQLRPAVQWKTEVRSEEGPWSRALCCEDLRWSVCYYMLGCLTLSGSSSSEEKSNSEPQIYPWPRL